MAGNHDKIEVQGTSEGESGHGCSKWNVGWWKSDKGTVVSKFLTESSLHGLKYIGEPKRHIVERTFWIVAFIVGLVAAGFLIYEVFDRYEETPVIVSFQSKEQPVDTIPFPAVTFCSNNQISKAKVDNLKWRIQYLSPSEPEYSALREKLFTIDSVCWYRKSFFGAHREYFRRTSFPRSDYYYLKNQSKLQQEIIDLFLEFTPSCEEMIPFIMLDGTPIKTNLQVFKPVFTEHGKCCTFNMLPTPLMLKHPGCFGNFLRVWSVCLSENLVKYGSQVIMNFNYTSLNISRQFGGRGVSINIADVPNLLPSQMSRYMQGQLELGMKGTFLVTLFREPSPSGGGARQTLMIGKNGVTKTVSYYPQLATKAKLRLSMCSYHIRLEVHGLDIVMYTLTLENEMVAQDFNLYDGAEINLICLTKQVRSFAVEPYCDQVTFRGTTFLLHNPVDTPRVNQFPSVIGANQESFIKIHPDITLADPDIKDLKAEKRQCLFGKEKSLKYFTPYTQGNCFEDCIANLIDRNCGCSMFYMPRTNETLLCELSTRSTEANCVSDTLNLLSNKEICGDCLPLCEYIDYNFEMTTASISNSQSYQYNWFYVSTSPYTFGSPYINTSDLYRNISFAHIFYGSPSTVPKLRKRLYGMTDLIANTGGILGLCLGFSALSGAEVLYYGLLRIVWQILHRRKQSWNTKRTSGPNTIGNIELAKPFNSSNSENDKKITWTKVFSKSVCKTSIIKTLRFRLLCCIVVGVAASGFLVYTLAVKSDDTNDTKETFENPLESDKNTETYWAEATFCYMNQFSMEKVLELRRIVNSTMDEHHRNSAETNLSMINAMCIYKDALETSSSNQFPPITPEVANYTFLMKFLEENTISCQQMFPACVYMGMVQETCSEIIKSVDTIHGKCCRFRMAPALPKFISTSDDNMTSISESFNGSLDSNAGVDQNISMENTSLFDMAEFNSSYFMVHQAKLSDEFSIYKQPSHFSVLLNLNEDAYQCDNLLTSTNQILFALHSPGNFPKMQDYHSLFVANQEVIITVFPATTYSDDRKDVISKEEKECSSYEWLTDYGEGFKTTKAAYFDGCLRKFISQNCKCGFMGYEMEYWESFPEISTCKTDSNSNDTICMKRMRELVSKLKHICHIHQTPCSGTAYGHITTNQPIKNASQLWASLRRFGNDTTLEIPWSNNITGIIHFAFHTSPQTKSTNNADMGGFLSVILITVVSCLICFAIIVFPHLWRCICSMMVKASLYLRGVLHARKISALHTNVQP